MLFERRILQPRGHHPAGEIIARRAALGIGELAEIGEQLRARFCLFGIARAHVAHQIGPVDQSRRFLGRHAEHVGDHQHRHPDRDPLDEIEPFAARGIGDQPFDNGAEGRAAGGDLFARQAGHDNGAQLAVEWRVGVVDRRRAVPLGAAVPDLGALARQEHRMIARCGDHIGMAGHTPEARAIGLGIEPQTGHPAQLGKCLMLARRLERSEIEQVDGAHCGSPLMVRNQISPHAFPSRSMKASSGSCAARPTCT